MNEPRETNRYEDFVAESRLLPTYAQAEAELLAAQSTASQPGQLNEQIDTVTTLPRKIRFRIRQLTISIGRSLQTIYPYFRRFRTRSSDVGEVTLAATTREDLVLKLNNIAADLENLRLNVQDSMAQLSEIEENPAIRRRNSL